MKFDYVIHLTRNGDRKYTFQIQDKSGDTPFTSKPMMDMDWAAMWAVIPRAIESRENKKVEELKAAAAAAKLSEPKDWVPPAAGVPASTPEAAKAPKGNRYIKQPGSGAGASSNPNPTP